MRVEKNLNEASSKINVISSVREPHRTAKLEDAKIVVAGGRGVRNSEGFNSIRELALLLGGEVGATPAGRGCPLDFARTAHRSDR